MELTLIVGLAAGLYLQNRALKRDKGNSDAKLSQANDELKHLRRMLDKILMVEKGYARPGEDVDEEEEVRKHRPTRLL
jgi:hypothetical protein